MCTFNRIFVSPFTHFTVKTLLGEKKKPNNSEILFALIILTNGIFKNLFPLTQRSLPVSTIAMHCESNLHVPNVMETGETVLDWFYVS